MSTTRIFVSYSHEDDRWFADDSLIPWLARSLKRDEVEIWWDRGGIEGGDPWRRMIESEIDRAHIALLMVSQGFLNSEFIEKVELPRIKARAESDELVVIPILTEPCEWDEHEFVSSRQMVPSKATPLINYVGPGREAEWAQVRYDILSVIRKRIRTIWAQRSAGAGVARYPAERKEGEGPATTRDTSLPLPATLREISLSWLATLRRIGLPAAIAPVVALAVLVVGWQLYRGAQAQATPVPGSVPLQSEGAPPTRALAPAGIQPPVQTQAPVQPPAAASAGPALQLANTLSYGNRVSGVSFSPDGKTLASSSDDGTVTLWDLASGSQLRNFAPEQSPIATRLSFSADGKLLGTGRFDVKLWDAATGKQVRELGHDGTWQAFSPDGKLIATTGTVRTDVVGAREAVKLWDAATGDELGSLAGHTDTINALAFSGDSKMLATASQDQTVRLWDVAAGKELKVFRGHGMWVYSVAVSPDGKTIASGSVNGDIKLWDAASGKELATLKEHNNDVKGLVFTVDGTVLISAGWDQKIRVWGVASGQRLRTLSGHTAPIGGLGLSADGKTLVSGSEDGTIRLWTVQ